METSRPQVIASVEHFSPRGRSARDQGFVLIAVIGALTIMLLILTSYVPDVMRAVRREREEEMLFRGQEIVTAIQKFNQGQGTQGRYPTSLQQLSDGVLVAGNRSVRYLRASALKDPMTNDGKWKLVRYRDPVIQQFFDAYFKNLGLAPNPMVIAKYTGIMPKGLAIPAGANMGISGMPQPLPRFRGKVQTAPGEPGGPGMPGAPGGVPGVPGIPPTTPDAALANDPAAIAALSVPGGLAPAPGTGTGSSAGFGQFGQFGQTDENGILAGPFLGVVSRSKKKSVRVFYDDLDHYDSWPFIYIPELASMQIINQDQRITALMSPIIYPSDPLALLVQMMQGQGGPRIMVNPRPQPQGGTNSGVTPTPGIGPRRFN